MINVADIDRIYLNYETTEDCYRIAINAYQTADAALFSKTTFVGKTKNEAEQALDPCRDQLDEMVILNLWASFENSIREYIKPHFACLTEQSPQPYFHALHDKIVADVNYWKLSDLLDLLKERINANDIGQAKNIKKFRDWLAHGKPRKDGTPAQVTPGYAWRILREILRAL